MEATTGMFSERDCLAKVALATQPTARGVSAGTIRLEIRGTIRYADIFADFHETRFCGFYNVKRSKFSVCPKGNAIR